VELEHRRLPVSDLEIRADTEEDKMVISGYAALFNRKSEDLGGFVEILRPGSFRKVLEKNPDVKALFNHDPSTIFARSKNESLKLTENQTGLKFEAVISEEDEDAKRIYHKVKNGLIDQCSFAFGVGEEGQKWADGNPMTREIFEVDVLADVSVVTNPAYPQTSAEARSVLQEAGFDFDGLTSLIVRAQRGLTLTDSDRDLINASIQVLQGLLPEDEGDADTHNGGDAHRLHNIFAELELLETKHNRRGEKNEKH